jgi:hypothetical protein
VIRFACPKCTVSLQEPDSLAGSRVACGNCGHHLQERAAPLQQTLQGIPLLESPPSPPLVTSATTNWRGQVLLRDLEPIEYHLRLEAPGITGVRGPTETLDQGDSETPPMKSPTVRPASNLSPSPMQKAALRPESRPLAPTCGKVHDRPLRPARSVQEHHLHEAALEWTGLTGSSRSTTKFRT